MFIERRPWQWNLELRWNANACCFLTVHAGFDCLSDRVSNLGEEEHLAGAIDFVAKGPDGDKIWSSTQSPLSHPQACSGYAYSVQLNCYNTTVQQPLA